MYGKVGRILLVSLQLVAILAFATDAEAKHRCQLRLRLFRSRHVCCPISCEPSAGACACVIELFYDDMAGTYFYYAHFHDDCDNCNPDEPCFWISNEWLPSQLCRNNDGIGECEPVFGHGEHYLARRTMPPPTIKKRDYELTDDRQFKFPATFYAEHAAHPNDIVRVRLPDGDVVPVKIFYLYVGLLRPRIPDRWITVGFQVEDDGSGGTPLEAEHCIYDKHVYKFEFPGSPKDQTCIVLTNHE